MYGSACFGRHDAHHQELNNCSRKPLVLPLELGGSSAVGRGRAGRPDCYHHAPTVKPEAATAVVEFLMMDVRTPETC